MTIGWPTADCSGPGYLLDPPPANVMFKRPPLPPNDRFTWVRRDGEVTLVQVYGVRHSVDPQTTCRREPRKTWAIAYSDFYGDDPPRDTGLVGPLTFVP